MSHAICTLLLTLLMTIPSIAADPEAILIPPSFFGMHLADTGGHHNFPWPTAVSFSSIRTGPNEGVTWEKLNPSENTYDWSRLDAVVDKAMSHGVSIVFHQGGEIPAFVSSNGKRDGIIDIAAYKNYMTRITDRYKGKILYWELWNEPSNPNNEPQNLVAMCAAAYPIIKAAYPANVVISPSPQGSSAYKWLDGFFAKGGDAYVDVVAFHGYVYGAPEKQIALVSNVRAVQAKYPKLAGKPIWDTEHSWGTDKWPWSASLDQKAAWLARFITLTASAGVQRAYWYIYDSQLSPPANPGDSWGALANRYEKGPDGQFVLLPTGVAHRNVYDWLVNARIDPCSIPESGDGLGQCRITRSGGYEGRIVWASSPDPSYTMSYTVPFTPGYSRYRTIDGKVVPISGGNKLTLTMKPILLEATGIAK